VSAPLEPPFEHDAGDMAGLLEGIPGQIEDALARLAAAPWKLSVRMPSTLAVGAMGGSAIAADLTNSIYRDVIMRPIVVVRDYHWPAFVTREAFALHCSYSGATEETLALYREASQRQVPRAALTTGGSLAAACDRDGMPWHKLPGGMPPRAALYSSWVPLTGLLAALEWCDDPARAWREAATLIRELQQRIGVAVPEEGNPAKQLARALLGRHLMIYGSASRTGAAATRFRQQLNENAKLPAHSAVVPELNHNEIVGWEHPEEPHRPTSAVMLMDPEDRPEIAQRLALTAQYVRRQGCEVHVLEAGPGSRLARLAQHVVWGDYLSFYLAQLRGVDPTPIASIDDFKRRMAAAGKEH
jgi:glucose/mannose-6-phosphate isomerase